MKRGYVDPPLLSTSSISCCVVGGWYAVIGTLTVCNMRLVSVGLLY